MTNEEAKEKIFYQWQDFLEHNIDYAGISEAYKMAIKALEQEPTDEWQNGYDMAWEEAKVFYETEPCDDAVSRQAVLNEFYDVENLYNRIKQLPSVTQKPIECEDAISRKTIIEHYSTGEIARYKHISRNNLLNFIKQLPSVTPQPKTGHWIKIESYPLQMHDYECSECSHETDDNTEDYCSGCGARMVEPLESEDKE